MSNCSAISWQYNCLAISWQYNCLAISWQYNCSAISWQYNCSAISWQYKITFPRWGDKDIRFVLDQHAGLNFYSAHWNKSPLVDMSTHCSDSDQTRLLLLLNVIYLAEEQHIPILLSGLTRPGLKLTNHHTRG